MSFAGLGEPPVPAYQNLGEFGRLWDLVASRPHARVLEIGSLFGGTLWWWSHLPSLEMMVTVDLPSEWAQVRDDVIEARRHWAGWFDVPFVDYQADSHDPSVVEVVERILDGDLFDVAFIDGDHSYEGVRQDWLLWSPLVREGGLVAFHDTWPDSAVNTEPGVARWCDELRHHLPSAQFTDPDGVGICVFGL